MPGYVVNPQTNRCIRTDSAVYKRLVKLNIIKDDLPAVGANRVYKIKEEDTDTEIEQVKNETLLPPHKKLVRGKGKNKGFLVKKNDIRPETMIEATVSAQQKCEDGNTDVLSDLEKRIAAHLGLIEFN